METEADMDDSHIVFGTDSPPARSGRMSNLASWIVVAVCCASLVVYLALHTRELRLIREWLTFQ